MIRGCHDRHEEEERCKSIKLENDRYHRFGDNVLFDNRQC